MNYPLFLTHQNLVIGNGFVAEISARAQVLAVQEDDGGWWLNGVRPGAMAEPGDNLDQANLAFRETLRVVFADFASEASGFDEFKARVKSFFDQTDAESVAEWEGAVDAIRAGAEVDLDLPRIKAEEGAFVSVIERTAHLTGGVDVQPQQLAKAA